MKPLIIPALFATHLAFQSAALAAPTAILTRVSGNVVVQRGGQKLAGKAGLALQKGDRVVVVSGAATVFTLGAPPRTLQSGSLVVGGVAAAKSGSPALWKSVYRGLERGLNRRDSVIAAAIRPGELLAVSPVQTVIETARPRFEWKTPTPSPRYEVVVRQDGKEIWRDQMAETSLLYPASAPPLSGACSWLVVPLRLEKGIWVVDTAIKAVAPSPFQVAPAAQLAALRADLKLLDAQLKTLPVERTLARAARWRADGFNEAALRELASAPDDPTARDLRNLIWRDMGQLWRIEAPVAVKKQPLGKADPTYLALAPNQPFAITRRKGFVAPDRSFALQIPNNFCVANFKTTRGATGAEFAALPGSGARFTFCHGPAKDFGGAKSLLANIKSTIDANNKSAKNGGQFILVPQPPTVFRGHQAKRTMLKSVSPSGVSLGEALEWTQNGESYLYLFGDSSSATESFGALRSLLDSLQLGAAVPAVVKQRTEQEFLDAAEAEVKQRRVEWDKDAQFSADFQTTAPPTGTLADLDSLEKARLAAPDNSYERSIAAVRAARGAAQLAGLALEKGERSEAERLFKLSEERDRESYSNALGALRAGIAQCDERIAAWSAFTPGQDKAAIYDILLDFWKMLKVQRLRSIRTRAIIRGDMGEQDKCARQLFETQRALLVDRRLSATDPKPLFEQQIEMAKSLDNLGAAALNHADLDGARSYSERALVWRQAVPASYPHRDFFETLRERVRIESELGDLRLARQFAEQAIADQDQAAPQHDAYVQKLTPDVREAEQINWLASRSLLYTQLGTIFNKLGSYAQAETQFDLALKTADKLPTTGYSRGVRSRMRAGVLTSLATLHADSGDLDGSVKFLGEASDLYRDMGNSSMQALMLFDAAGAEYNSNQFETALAKLRDARALYELLQQPQEIIDCDVLESSIADSQGNHDRAIELARSALQRARALGSPGAVSAAGRGLANAFLNTVQNYELAPAVEREAEEVLGEVVVADKRTGYSQNEIQTYKLRARLKAVQGMYGEALDLVTAGITRNEAVRSTSAYGDQFAAQDGNSELYDLAVQLLLKLKRPEEAFDMLGRARTKKLRDTLSLRAMQSNDPALQALLKRAAALDEKLVKTRAQLVEAQAKPVPERDTQRVQNLQQLIASTQAEFFQVSEQLKAKNPRFSQALSLSPTELKKAQKSIPAGALLLQYAPLDDGLYIFAVTKTSLQIFEPKVSSQDLSGAIRAYRGAIDADIGRLQKGEAPQSIDSADSPLRMASEKLSKWLLEPVRKEIDAAQTVAIVPSGELFYLPFHALGESGKDGQWHFLIEDKPVAYLAKGDVLSVGLDRDRENEGQGILALGDPAGADLPAAKLEVESIGQIFPGSRVFTGAGASKAVLLQPSTRENRVLHLAAHGVLDSSQPDRSYIQLSPSANDDGKLHVGEILGIDLNKVDLVTLSACQTALGEGHPDGTEISSLAQSFSTAGTPTVIASLWNVEDQSTKRLMEAFYGALADGVPKGMALEKAQVKLLQDPKTRHPVFWAPFELMGDWR
jgi:CHAT domain-containing protein